METSKNIQVELYINRGKVSVTVREWAFVNTKYDYLYSYRKYSNVPSCKTAQKIGMKKSTEYPDEKNDVSFAFVISREEWKKSYAHRN